MADYHEGKPPPSPSTSAQTTRATQQNHNAASPYQYQPPSVTSDYAIDGLATSSSSIPLGYGHGPRAVQVPSFAPSSNNLNATSQPEQNQGNQQHHGNVSPSLQYPSALPANNTPPSGSPPGHQAPTPTDPVSPPTSSATPAGSKAKSTRIPRACDLCSQRKVKVRRLLGLSIS